MWALGWSNGVRVGAHVCLEQRLTEFHFCGPKTGTTFWAQNWGPNRVHPQWVDTVCPPVLCPQCGPCFRPASHCYFWSLGWSKRVRVGAPVCLEQRHTENLLITACGRSSRGFFWETGLTQMKSIRVRALERCRADVCSEV